MIGGATTPTLPELVMVNCPECGGAGFHECVTPLGVDHSTRCATCYGAGKVEVCSGCRTAPTVRNGVDFCSCVAAAELGRVA
jgi:DnaJ-class molecular chaperone